MKIAVVDFAASIGGAQSILLDFYRYATEQVDDIEWVFFVGDVELEEKPHLKVIKILTAKQKWVQRLRFDWLNGRIMINSLHLDAVINLQNTLVRGVKSSQFLYIHQSIPFQKAKRFSFFNKSERIYAIYQYIIGYLIKISAKKAKAVFVQTQWMKDALSKYKNKNDIFVIPPTITVPEINERCKLDTTSFIYPANKILYKNHSLIIKAVERLSAENITDFSVVFTIDKKDSFPDTPHQIHYVGILPREELMKLYRSSIMVFPSYIETYGLPLEEAKVMGGTIFASRTEFSREILEGYENSYFFDPFCEDELVALMRRAITHQIELKDSMERNNTRQNSWKQLVDIIKEQIHEKKSI